ncbi:MAG TPA: acyltransferase [Polyangia bacterium]|nr:acyltransferase [Polyangia bacterium]
MEYENAIAHAETSTGGGKGAAVGSPYPATRSWLWSRFRRVTTSGAYVPEIDGLRFLFVAMVVAYHLNPAVARNWALNAAPSMPGTMTRILDTGLWGVRLFFVLSGYILSLPFASSARGLRAPPNIRRYFWRRVTRLEPPYIAALTLSALGLLVLGQGSVGSMAKDFAVGLIYGHGVILGQLNPLDCVTWSLEVEVQFYCAMPVLALAFKIRGTAFRRIFLAVAPLLTCVLTRAFLPRSPRWAFTLPNYLHFFLVGMLLAELAASRSDDIGSDSDSGTWDFVALGTWVALVLSWMTSGNDLLILPLMATFFWAALHGRRARQLLRLPVISAIGGMCYTIYLIHYPVIAVAGKIVWRMGRGLGYLGYTTVQFVLITVAVLAASTIFFKLIEQPCMDPRWPAKLRGALRGLWLKVRRAPGVGPGFVSQGSTAESVAIPLPPGGPDHKASA